MKKLLSILIAIVLMLSLSVTAFAEETTPNIILELTDSYGDGWETVTIKACLVKSDGSEEILMEGMTVTLQSDFKLRNEQGAELGFTINNGAIVNNTQLISVTGNGDKNNPLSLTTDNLAVEIAEEAKYSGTYQGTITFTIAVSTAENN